MKRLVPLLLIAAVLAGCAGPQTTATLVVDGPTPDEVVLSFSPDDAPSAPYYGQNEVMHPGTYTAFDLTVQWAEAADVTLDVGYSAEFGFFLNAIDGVGYDPETGEFWSLWVDGVMSDVGMDQVIVEDGMTVLWNYEAAAF